MISRTPSGPTGEVRPVFRARPEHRPGTGRRRLSQAVVLCLAAAFPHPALAATAETSDVDQYSLAPNQAESGKPVTLTVSGYTGLCNPHFSHQIAAVEGGQIHLELLPENDPLSKCSDTTRPFHTDFQTPALVAGSYAVDISFRPACSYQEPLCPFALTRYPAGTLTVRDSADLGYTIRPKQVEAGKAFDLLLTRKGFACGASFTDLASGLNGHFLNVEFAISPVTVDTACPVPLPPQGPVFHVAALPAGTYQILALQISNCRTPGCPIAAIAPQLAGALTVGAPTSIGPTSRRTFDVIHRGSAESEPYGRIRVPWRGSQRDLAGRENHPGLPDRNAAPVSGTEKPKPE
jgi:hypothetical protein